MPKTIYVPQGYSARLIKASEACGITGLFTDGFTSCNIVACIGKNTLVLMHIDAQTFPENVQSEIESVDEPKEIIFIYRNDKNYSGQYIKTLMLKHLKQEMPSIKIIEKEIDNAYDGIYLTFQTQVQNDIHPNILKYPLHKRPEGLIHHPQEQQFLAVQKIEQLIGKRYTYQTQLFKDKQFYIFDGRAWEPLSDAELKIEQSHPLTKEEMDFFSIEDTYITIAGKLADIAQLIKKHIPIASELDDLVMPIAFYLEGYLNDFNYSLLFKRNVQCLINDELYKPESAEDINFKHTLIKILTNETDVFNEMVQLTAKYYQQASETNFKKSIRSECDIFCKHYKDRKYYNDIALANTRIKTRIEDLNKLAALSYREKKYDAAINLFMNVVRLCTYRCTKSDPDLAVAYYNTGRALYQRSLYQQAYFFIQTSLLLRENYTLPKPSDKELDKIRNALKECEEKINQNLSEQFQKTLSL